MIRADDAALPLCALCKTAAAVLKLTFDLKLQWACAKRQAGGATGELGAFTPAQALPIHKRTCSMRKCAIKDGKNTK